MAMPRKGQDRGAQSQREQQEEDGRHHYERIGLLMPGHDDQCARERYDICQVIRRDVDEDRRLDRGWWHLALLERLRDQNAAAQTRRGQRLIGKQFGETELERRCASQVIASRSADSAPDPALGDVRSGLQEHRYDEPPGSARSANRTNARSSEKWSAAATTAASSAAPRSHDSRPVP